MLSPLQTTRASWTRGSSAARRRSCAPASTSTTSRCWRSPARCCPTPPSSTSSASTASTASTACSAGRALCPRRPRGITTFLSFVSTYCHEFYLLIHSKVVKGDLDSTESVVSEFCRRVPWNERTVVTPCRRPPSTFRACARLLWEWPCCGTVWSPWCASLDLLRRSIGLSTVRVQDLREYF